MKKLAGMGLLLSSYIIVKGVKNWRRNPSEFKHTSKTLSLTENVKVKTSQEPHNRVVIRNNTAFWIDNSEPEFRLRACQVVDGEPDYINNVGINMFEQTNQAIIEIESIIDELCGANQ